MIDACRACPCCKALRTVTKRVVQMSPMERMIRVQVYTEQLDAGLARRRAHRAARSAAAIKGHVTRAIKSQATAADLPINVRSAAVKAVAHVTLAGMSFAASPSLWGQA